MTWNFEMAARTAWFECRSEPPAGQQAVCHTLWNRLRVGRWGSTLASVVHWPEHSPSQLFMFSGWNAHDPNLIPMLQLADDNAELIAMRAVLTAAMNETDLTKGALCYYNPKIAPKPHWAFSLRFCGQFGNQLFYTDNPENGARA